MGDSWEFGTLGDDLDLVVCLCLDVVNVYSLECELRTIATSLPRGKALWGACHPGQFLLLHLHSSFSLDSLYRSLIKVGDDVELAANTHTLHIQEELGGREGC